MITVYQIEAAKGCYLSALLKGVHQYATILGSSTGAVPATKSEVMIVDQVQTHAKVVRQLPPSTESVILE